MNNNCIPTLGFSHLNDLELYFEICYATVSYNIRIYCTPFMFVLKRSIGSLVKLPETSIVIHK